MVILKAGRLGGGAHGLAGRLAFALVVWAVVDDAAKSAAGQQRHVRRLQLGSDGDERGQSFYCLHVDVLHAWGYSTSRGIFR